MSPPDPSAEQRPDAADRPLTADPADPILRSPVVAIGGSAGALGPLVDLVGGLPADLNAPVLVTFHLGEQSRSQLPAILSRSGPLPAVRARDGDQLHNGCVYVAPPGRHLMVVAGRTRLGSGPRVNRHRPAVDVLFASVATFARARTVGVVLSGVLDDGAVGAALIAQAGGRMLVQDPAGAEFDGMPSAALAAVPDAGRLDPADPASAIVKQVEVASRAVAPLGYHEHLHRAKGARMNEDMAASGDPGYLSADEARLTRMACPECGGALAEVELPTIVYFRCHVGHQYAPQTLAAAQQEAVEAKLWSAVAALDEQAAFAGYLSRGRRASGPNQAEDPRIRALTDRAATLRDQVRQWTAGPAASGTDGNSRSPGVPAGSDVAPTEPRAPEARTE